MAIVEVFEKLEGATSKQDKTFQTSTPACSRSSRIPT
jgi:hypothetical protein